jgi:threonine 3-dehydrogenase
MTVGHEYCGVIVELGSEVRGFKEGDRVSGEGHITCGYCRNCKAGRQHLCRNTVGVGVNRPGAFAEYIALPATNVFQLPPQVSDDHASFMDALGNAVHTALSFDLIGEDVLITWSRSNRLSGRRRLFSCRGPACPDHRYQRLSIIHCY